MMAADEAVRKLPSDPSLYYDGVGTGAQLAATGVMAYYMASRIINAAVAPSMAIAMVFGEFVASLATYYTDGSALDRVNPDNVAGSMPFLLKRTIKQLVIALPLAFVGAVAGQLFFGKSVAIGGTLLVATLAFLMVRIATIAAIGVIVLGVQASKATGSLLAAIC